tara:strand:+ start:7529 stop:8491 length:963 start_codon:yes stop_codon:yes gene_type:complete
MDDISNYIGATGAISQQNEEYKTNLKALGEEMKNKIKEFTDPIGTAFMMEGGKSVLTNTVNNFSKSLVKTGTKAKDVMDMADAYKKGGIKGLVKHLKGKMETPEPGIESTESTVESNISDLSPSEWSQTSNTISTALKSRAQGFPENIQNKMARKFQNEKLDSSDEPDEALRQQKNAQKINDIMDEQEENTQTLGNNLLQNPTVRNLASTQDDDDSILNTTQRTFSGISKKISSLNEDSSVVKAGSSDLKTVVEKAGEKAVSRAGEEDLAEFGPEDVVGDVVSTLVGIGTFIGGVFGARHKSVPQAMEVEPANISYQSGV